MKFKLAAIGGVLLLLVVAGVVQYWQINKSQKQADIKQENTNASLDKTELVSASGVNHTGMNGMIHITDKGFSPDTITVNLGGEVSFYNLDKEPHWPASDPHPTHTIYPEFDPKTQIEVDKEWKFVFNKPGAWGFHDHYNPQFVGKVIVRDADGKIPEDILKQQEASKNPNLPPDDSCMKNTTPDYACYETYYQAMVRTKGTKPAFEDLKKRYEADAYVVAQCHPLTHVIGRETAKKYTDVAQAYKEGDSLCWSGFYHGVMEDIVGRVGRTKIANILNTICDGVPGKATYSFEYFNCVHGLGHGLMAITNNELPESLKTCDNLMGSWEQSSCYGGAFMENVMVDHRAHKTKYLDPERPLYPCDSVDNKYRQDCYLMQTSYMVKITNSNFSKIFELCEGAKEHAPTCYQSLGRDASGGSVSDPVKTKATCELGKNFEQQSNCVVGAVKDFVSYYHGEKQAVEFCNSLAADIKEVCLYTEKEYYKSF